MSKYFEDHPAENMLKLYQMTVAADSLLKTNPSKEQTITITMNKLMLAIHEHVVSCSDCRKLVDRMAQDEVSGF